MEVAFRRKEKSNKQSDNKLEFIRLSNSFGILKGENDQYDYKNPKSGQKDTMSFVKNNTALGIQVSVALGDRSNQYADNNKDKISRCPRDFEISKKRKVQNIQKHDNIKSKSEGEEEDTLVCSKRTKFPSRKGLELKKCHSALKKKRKFEDNNSLEDEEDFVPSKTNSRSKIRKMDTVKDTGKTSRICHHCMKKERSAFVPCTKCQRMYCVWCIRKWYPDMSIEDIAENCPFCRKNCNCNVCLSSRGIIKV